MNGWRRRILFALVSIVLGSIAGLTLGELGARLVLGRSYPIQFVVERVADGGIARRGGSRSTINGVPYSFDDEGFQAECQSPAADNPPNMYIPYLKLRSIVQTLDTPWLDLCQVAASDDNFGAQDKHYSAVGNARVGEALAQNLAPLVTRSQ